MRKMKKIYAARRKALVGAIRALLGDVVKIEPANSGLRVVIRLPAGVDDKAVEQAAAREGIVCYALSGYCKSPGQQPGLLLGFACIQEREISEGMARLAPVIRRFTG